MRRKVAALLIVWLFVIQLSCGGRSGGGEVATGARPAPHFKPGFNLFSPEQDIEMGRQSAQQVAQQVPILNDAQTVNYIRSLGAKLAAKAPGFNFPYQFNVVATRDINAFALPGGFVFVNAGAIAAAKDEGELAGVMAHEISHVALRHGTNQASKAYIANAGIGILRTLAGGSRHPDLDEAIRSIGGLGANMVFLKFGRTAESQADLEGARLMASVGYDPRDMAAFFQTLEAKGGQRAPEFLSDHPDPGNRIQAINNELRSLSVNSNPIHDTNEFEQIKARLTGNNAALNSSNKPSRVGPSDPENNKSTSRPEPPAASFTQFQARDGSFALQYPQNWDALVADDANMIFAPKGAYGQLNDSVVVTHGIFIGAVSPQAQDLAGANAAFVQHQIESNQDFRLVRQPQEITFGDRRGFATVVAGPSTVTGVIEVDVIYTSATADGRLFYLITMVPEDELDKYQSTFEQIIRSVRLAR